MTSLLTSYVIYFALFFRDNDHKKFVVPKWSPKVTQDHRQCHHSTDGPRLPISLPL